MSKAKSIVRKTEPSATEKPAPVGFPPQKPFPPLTLISKATAKYPLADTDPRTHLGSISDRLREIAKYGKHLDELMQLDDQNPVIIGTTYFFNELMERVSELAIGVDDVVAMLEPDEKGGQQ